MLGEVSDEEKERREGDTCRQVCGNKREEDGESRCNEQTGGNPEDDENIIHIQRCAVEQCQPHKQNEHKGDIQYKRERDTRELAEQVCGPSHGFCKGYPDVLHLKLFKRCDKDAYKESQEAEELNAGVARVYQGPVLRPRREFFDKERAAYDNRGKDKEHVQDLVPDALV